ncbi:hypothetical protein AG1IA_09607 [Rhizoctonia solani AG-1 IA]|uniref:Uncharacterized protein n=1 Tax=Thanatephorus cucumeris (strain AG1-IA) TaxID=983506 RepID=L8WJ35_THACA|nr:hypothetical protein AG1IA_09607 [Rhizoctonia solani AG-1 IA]
MHVTQRLQVPPRVSHILYNGSYVKHLEYGLVANRRKTSTRKPCKVKSGVLAGSFNPTWWLVDLSVLPYAL